MTQRPRQHILEDLARAALHRIFSERGWAVEDLSKDYGEDLLVRIFDAGHATPLYLFIQSKATDKLKTVVRDKKTFVSIRLSNKNIHHWKEFWQPVVLTVFDSHSGVTYWEIVQDAAANLVLGPSPIQEKKITLHVPATNTLDLDGLSRLRYRTRLRFERFQSQKEGAEIVIKHLKEAIGVEVHYEPEGGILMIPKGQFIPDGSGDMHLITFGRLAIRFQSLCERTGLSAEEVMHNALETLCQVESSFERGEVLQLRDKNGEVLDQWKTRAELQTHLDRIDIESDE